MAWQTFIGTSTDYRPTMTVSSGSENLWHKSHTPGLLSAQRCTFVAMFAILILTVRSFGLNVSDGAQAHEDFKPARLGPNKGNIQC